MKRWIALLLAAVLCLSLAACGESNNATESDIPVSASEQEEDSTPESETEMSKEEMLANAEDVDASDISDDSAANIVKAKQQYCNKTLLLTGIVTAINEDHIEVAGSYRTVWFVDVYLPVEEMVDLRSGQMIVVVGQTTDEITDTSVNAAGYTFNYSHYQMPIAYLVQDTFEVEGILYGANQSYAPAYNIGIGNSDVLNLIYFKEDVDTSALTYKQKIKFSAVVIKQTENWDYYDATIISVEEEN